MDKAFSKSCRARGFYIGEAERKGASYPEKHDAIIDRAVWDRAEAAATNARQGANRTRAQTPAFLKEHSDQRDRAILCLDRGGEAQVRGLFPPSLFRRVRSSSQRWTISVSFSRVRRS
jgi:hypothetical protein